VIAVIPQLPDEHCEGCGRDIEYQWSIRYRDKPYCPDCGYQIVERLKAGFLPAPQL
jgi:predicted RNA-binding Zn-ribbon protein involved in translation (DUF1610 family)